MQSERLDYIRRKLLAVTGSQWLLLLADSETGLPEPSGQYIYWLSRVLRTVKIRLPGALHSVKIRLSGELRTVNKNLLNAQSVPDSPNKTARSALVNHN